MLPPIAYIGCKRREIKHIHDNQPIKFNKVVDLMGGSGCVVLSYVDTDKKIIYNEVNNELCELFNTLKSKKKIDELIKCFEDNKNILCTEDFFYKVYDKDIYYNPQFRIVYLSRMCMKGMINTRKPNMKKNKITGINEIDRIINIENLKKKFSEYPSKIKRLKIYNKSYKDILNKYKDDENAFIYIDPPYLQKPSMNKDFYDVNILFDLGDLEYIIKVMRDKTTKAKIMLNIDYTGYTREMFKDLFRCCYPVEYNMSNNNKNIYTKYHIMLCNY